jgi:hypothetical protein
LIGTVHWPCSQSRVVSVLIPSVVWLRVVYERNGCSSVVLASSRWLLPANEKRWLVRMP